MYIILNSFVKISYTFHSIDLFMYVNIFKFHPARPYLVSIRFCTVKNGHLLLHKAIEFTITRNNYAKAVVQQISFKFFSGFTFLYLIYLISR